MKKIIFCLLVCFSLSACINAGDFDLLPVRSKVFSLYRGHSVDFYDNQEKIINTQKVRENKYDMNKALTVRKGEDVLNDRVMEKVTYQKFVGKFNKKGALNNNLYPLNVNTKDEHKIVGWTTIDNNRYTIIGSNVDDYVFLFNEQGNLYEKGGRIENDRLILLEDTLFAYPNDLKLIVLNKMRDEVNGIKNGYQLKYGGIKFDRLFFDYLGFDNVHNTTGEFKQINFPNKPGLIVVNGIGLRVLDASDNSLTYMILVNDM